MRTGTGYYVLTLRNCRSRCRESIIHIFEHLDYEGKYVNSPHDNPADMFCERIADVATTQSTFDSQGVEMLVWLDLDNNNCLLEYNRSYPYYAYMDSYSIPIINIIDIKGRNLYTKDGMILAFLRIHPISIDLLSKSEKISCKGSLRQSFPTYNTLLNS